MQDLVKILIVDDSPEICDILRQSLKEYDVYAFTNSLLALERFEEISPAVCILDYNLDNGSTGFQLLEEFVKRYPPTQIIMITGVLENELMAQALRHGACDFLFKPMNLILFKCAVDKCVDKFILKLENINYQNRLECLVEERTLELKQANKQLGIILQQTVFSLMRTLEIRDPYTMVHQERVSILAAEIAKEMGLDGERIEFIRLSAMLHDLGKIYLPQEILAKPRPLSPAEFELVKTHCKQGYDILKDIPFPHPVAEVIYQHHEKLDGSGYPRELKSPNILLEARILTIADVVEAIASHRPYRPARPIQIAINEITAYIKIKYCEESVNSCISVLNRYDNCLELLFREKCINESGADCGFYSTFNQLSFYDRS